MYTETIEGRCFARGRHWASQLITSQLDEVERYDDEVGTLYRLAFRAADDSVQVLYIDRRVASGIFDQLLPEFMITTDDGLTADDETYVLTPRGRAMADGLSLVRTEIKYSPNDSFEEVTEIYE